MPRSSQFPRYPSKAHKTGQARLRIRGRDYYIGKWGSPASRAEYARLAAEFARAPDAPPVPRTTNRLSVTGVILRWLTHMEREYRPESREPEEYRTACTVVDRVCGPLPTEDFDAQALGLVQNAMASGSWMTDDEKAFRVGNKKPVGWCRNRVNRQVSRVRSVWKWAEQQGIVPRGAWAHLRTLGPLRTSSARARLTRPREPADWEHVKASLPFMPIGVAAMVELLWWTGMRPGEVCRMRAGEVDRSGEVWTYTMPPDQHKTGHLDGEAAVVAMGPEAQRMLGPWIDAARTVGPEAVVFPPGNRQRCKTYTRHSLRVAVARACKRAGVPVFCCYSLRHACRLRVTREAGMDAARAILRHKSMTMTAQYAKGADLKAASDAAKKTG